MITRIKYLYLQLYNVVFSSYYPTNLISVNENPSSPPAGQVSALRSTLSMRLQNLHVPSPIQSWNLRAGKRSYGNYDECVGNALTRGAHPPGCA